MLSGHISIHIQRAHYRAATSDPRDATPATLRGHCAPPFMVELYKPYSHIMESFQLPLVSTKVTRENDAVKSSWGGKVSVLVEGARLIKQFLNLIL